MRVLVVDDNVINQMAATDSLELGGYTVDVAANGAEAVSKVQAGPYCLILMDCRMPVEDGFSAAQRIRKWERETHQSGRLPIVALTAYASRKEREHAMDAGMDDFLEKPLDAELLWEKMSQLAPLEDPFTSSHWPRPEAPAEEPSAVIAKELTPGIRRSARLVAIFLRMVPQQLEELGDAISARDALAVHQHAHKLKGSCLAIDAPHMAELASALQFSSAEGDLSEAADAIVSLRGSFQLVKDELEMISA